MSGVERQQRQQEQVQQQQQQQQQQARLSGNKGLFRRPVAGVTLYEEVRTSQGVRYRPTTFAQIAAQRLRVV